MKNALIPIITLKKTCRLLIGDCKLNFSSVFLFILVVSFTSQPPSCCMTSFLL